MKKNFKFLSSLALAGILATNVIGTPAFAVTTDHIIKTEPVGIYKKLIEGKKVVPFVLANRNDKVTIRDINDSGKFSMTQFNGLSVPAENTVVCTGDTFVSNGEEYTVVIYGDVDKDGSISVVDALKIQQYRAHIEGVTLDPIQLEAANVMRADNSGVNIVDALHIQQYRAKITDMIIDKIPEQEPESEVKSNYTVTINEKGIINNVNIEDTKVKVQLAEVLTEDKKNVALKIINPDGSEEIIKNDITIPAYTSQVTVKIGNLSSMNIKEGVLTGKLVVLEGIEEKEELSTFTVTKNTEILPKAAQVRTERISTPEANMSFVACGDSDIVNMYYVVLENEEKAPTTLEELTESVAIRNNQLQEEIIANQLKNDVAYRIYYVLENSYGSRGEIIENAVITKDTTKVTREKALTKVDVPILTKEGENITTAEFTWTLADGETSTGKTFMVTLYKDGKIIKEVPVSNATTTTDFANEIREAGKYKVSVVVKGNEEGTSKDSESIQSSEIEVKALNSVSNIDFTIDEKNTKKITWDSEYDSKEIKEYQIQLLVLNQKKYEKFGNVLTTNEKEVAITIDNNKIYKAEVTVIAKDGQLAERDSKVETSEEFFTVATSSMTIDSKTESTVTLKLAKPVTIEGKTIIYDVEVYEVTGEDGTTKPKYLLSDIKENVRLVGDKIVVDGLADNKTYTFKLIAKVEEIKGESGFLTETTTLHKMPEIKNLTVSTEVGEGKIVKTTEGDLNIGGILISKADKNQYPVELTKVNALMDTLVPEDIITLEGKKLTLTLPNKASAEGKEDVRNFGAITEGMIVEIEGNKFSKTIKTTKGKQPKEVILKGNHAIFNLEDLNADKVILNNSLVVTAKNQPVTVASKATVNINGVEVKAQKDVTITAVNKTLTVTPNNGVNDLTFENTTEGDTTIKFNGLAGYGSTQEGEITIKSSVNGKISIAGTNMNIASHLNIDIEKGMVDISSNTLGGDKHVNITSQKNTQTMITAIAKTSAPTILKGKTLTLKAYQTEEEINELKAVLGLTEISTDLLAEIQNYINSFDINGKGATITIDAKDLTKVTITFDQNTSVEKVNIANIK